MINSIFFDPAFGESGAIKHYISNLGSNIIVGASVDMTIDLETRLINAKNHTAGHLLGFAVEKLTGVKGQKGYHFPEGCYVEFDGLVDIDSELIEIEMNKYIESKLPIVQRLVDRSEYESLTGQDISNVPAGKPLRIMQVESLGVMGCGGTHIQNTSEILSFKIRKVANKKGLTKISYVAS